jgi:hypothetical protein
VCAERASSCDRDRPSPPIFDKFFLGNGIGVDQKSISFFFLFFFVPFFFIEKLEAEVAKLAYPVSVMEYRVTYW